jgi:WD40 repeat protein
VTSIVLCPEFGVSVTASDDGSLASWDLHSLQLLHHVTLVQPYQAVHLPLHVAISAKSGDVAVSRGDTITLFTINLYKIVECSVGEKVTAIAISNQEEGVSTNCVVVGLQSGLVKLFSSLDLLHLRDILGMPNSAITALAYSEDSQNLAIATQDGVVTIMEKSGNRGLNRTPKYVTLQ